MSVPVDATEREACNAAFRAWADSIDRDDVEGDPKDLIRAIAQVMWIAGRDYATRRAEALAGEVARLREALEDIKLRYDDEGSFAARDMWRVAYEALEALAAAAAPQAAPADAGGEGE